MKKYTLYLTKKTVHNTFRMEALISLTSNLLENWSSVLGYVTHPSSHNSRNCRKDYKLDMVLPGVRSTGERAREWEDPNSNLPRVLTLEKPKEMAL